MVQAEGLCRTGRRTRHNELLSQGIRRACGDSSDRTIRLSELLRPKDARRRAAALASARRAAMQQVSPK